MRHPLAEFARDWVEAAEDAEKQAKRIDEELAKSRQKFGTPRIRR